MEECLVCNRIEEIKKGENPFFICELETSYVVLGDSQYFKGYTLLLYKEHVSELHHLSKKDNLLFLEEMSIVAEAVYYIFKPKKLNYELLGNLHNHLHWHIFPRHADDPNPNSPVWCIDKEIRNSVSLNAKDVKKMINQLKKEITHLTNK